ncbi:MAG: recombinase family protein [Cyanobacteria bacterium]|nr:recombinase family protein [Cyanobacteria bacterium CG_2015-16_32_12]NCO79201.1 recombinase family protein [Cyanobacteria bacterium CG_2015-22_32_23]NCQ04943.1 recombinase family protein [Cyanobacteria bacterium CG_2015-09_32_10]NCQ41280.1 recombinase family protein [Cyanobacteria bacterium CG_2015-04_32_10]NCS84464.1 recombinase family protein [Cyanobacteria bacterium CG_2015-02_32_10]
MSIIKSQPIWIFGNSCCGKTTRLASIISHWLEKSSSLKKPLILCSNEEGRKTLTDTLLNINPHHYSGKIKTPFAVIIEDVILFYPLIIQELGIKAHIPLKLRPETEQELATQLWKTSLTPELVGIFGNKYTCVRRILDFMQLAASGGIPPEEISHRLYQSMVLNIPNNQEISDLIGKLIITWRQWSLERGLLSYGLIYELYGRYLLPNTYYQSYLMDNYNAIFGDDVDDYPAIAGDLGKFFLKNNLFGAFTYNNTGKVRLGLNADAEYLKELSHFCHQESLLLNQIDSLGIKVEKSVIDLLNNNFTPKKIIGIESIVTNSRGELLTKMAEFIIESINSGKIKPEEVVIIVPGLDEIARYTLMNILNSNDIEIKPLNEQRPIITSTSVRSILTLLTLIYEGNGKLIDKAMIAEMLVILSQQKIDLVRAGLLTDYCYYPDAKSPRLLTIESFPRWDRLTHQSLESFNNIKEWLENTQINVKNGQNHLLIVIDDIIKHFFANITDLNYSQSKTLREFRETAQHFWQIQQRLGNQNNYDMMTKLVTLLRKGTITANPLPMEVIPFLKQSSKKAVTIASVYQYRSYRSHHPWQFWLDVGSHLWSQSSELFASSIFLKSWQSHSIVSDTLTENELVTRVIQDLLARVTEKVFLCHSELDINGKEQIGKLSTLVIDTHTIKSKIMMGDSCFLSS